MARVKAGEISNGPPIMIRTTFFLDDNFPDRATMGLWDIRSGRLRGVSLTNLNKASFALPCRHRYPSPICVGYTLPLNSMGSLRVSSSVTFLSPDEISLG